LFQNLQLSGYRNLAIGRGVREVRPELPDEEHSWLLHGGKGTLEGGWSTSGWTGSGSMQGVPPAKCQNLMLEGPVEGRSSLEVAAIEGMPKCPADSAEACYDRVGERRIRGPWKFDFDVPSH
jgi:hypothetical protein